MANKNKNKNKKMKNIEEHISTDKDKLTQFLNIISNGFTPYLIITVIALGVYFQTLSYGLTGLDDDVIIKNLNSMTIRNNPLDAFKRDAFLSGQSSEFYRPVQGFSYIIDSKTGDNNPFYFHLTNIIIHIICCCLIFYLISLFNNNKQIAFLITLLFAVHPLFNQAVIWLPSRGDLLVSMFSLISIISFIKFSDTKKFLFFFINIFSFFLAVFSKEISILLPLIFLIYYYFKVKKIGSTFNFNTIILCFIWIAIIIGYITIRANIVKGLLRPGQFGIMSFIYNLPVIPEFIAKFFFPFNLMVLPQFNMISTLIGLIFITGILFSVFKFRKYFGNYSFLFIGWFVLFTVTAMLYRHEHLNNAYDYLEHRAYMPLIGIVLLLSSIKINIRRMKLFTMSALTIFVIFASMTIIRASIFKDPVSFYTSAIDKGTRVALAYNNRGIIRKNLNDFRGALEDFNNAIEIKQDYELAYNNRGNIKDEFGDNNGALPDYNRSIELKPDNADAYLNRGNFYLKLRKFDAALKDLNKSLELMPDNNIALNNIGSIYGMLGNIPKAKRYFELAIQKNSNYSDAWKNLGVANQNLNDMYGACEAWRKASILGSNESKNLLIKFCK